MWYRLYVRNTVMSLFTTPVNSLVATVTTAQTAVPTSANTLVCYDVNGGSGITGMVLTKTPFTASLLSDTTGQGFPSSITGYRCARAGLYPENYETILCIDGISLNGTTPGVGTYASYNFPSDTGLYSEVTLSTVQVELFAYYTPVHAITFAGGILRFAARGLSIFAPIDPFTITIVTTNFV